MTPPLRSLSFFLVVCMLAAPAGYALAEAISGYDYLKPDTRAMQDDDFENPGILAVERGRELFNEKQPGASKSCAECHGESGSQLDTKSIARYPRIGEKQGDIIILQATISNCRKSVGSQVLPPNHADLVALETFVRNRASGETVNVRADGTATELLKKGEEIFQTRYGLIDMSCAHCHSMYSGQMIRGQKISQGQANGFPAYRLDIGEMTNLHQRIQQCQTSLRTEPFDAESDEIKLLGLYLMSRSNGLKIETPAVRY
jgi:sulfur-oxidizing protein SoxA